MKTIHDANSPLVKRIRKWKKDQGIVSLTLEALLAKTANKNVIVEEKIDGQSAMLSYKKGSAPVFSSLGGVIYEDLPVLAEAQKILESADIQDAEIVGEMAGYKDGKVIPFNETEHLIKSSDPSVDKNLIHWFVYEIVRINGDEIPEGFETYNKYWKQLKKLFDGAKFIHSVRDISGSTQAIKNGWDKFVLKEGCEGIVVRTEDDKVYKCKPIFTYDLVIVACGNKGSNPWKRKQVSNLLVAFLDNKGVFRISGNVGTGFTDEQSSELFKWMEKNQVQGPGPVQDPKYIFVKPERIIEIQWERSSKKLMPAYTFKNGKYVSEGKKVSGTAVKPRFLRYRTDKSVNPNDLRLTQVPNWNQKMARRIVGTILAQYIDSAKKEKSKYVLVKNKDGIPIMHWRAPDGKLIMVRDSKVMQEPPIGTTYENDPHGQGYVIYTPEGRRVFDFSEREEFRKEKENVQKWLREHENRR